MIFLPDRGWRGLRSIPHLELLHGARVTAPLRIMSWKSFLSRVGNDAPGHAKPHCRTDAKLSYHAHCFLSSMARRGLLDRPDDAAPFPQDNTMDPSRGYSVPKCPTPSWHPIHQTMRTRKQRQQCLNCAWISCGYSAP